MRPENAHLTYDEAMHGVQTGIALLMNYNTHFTEAKHLRVGVDSCMVTNAAVAQLLIAKGVITEDEYVEAVRIAAIEELERSEDALEKQPTKCSGTGPRSKC
jgi:hypothetical protein